MADEETILLFSSVGTNHFFNFDKINFPSF